MTPAKKPRLTVMAMGTVMVTDMATVMAKLLRRAVLATAAAKVIPASVAKNFSRSVISFHIYNRCIIRS